MLTSVEGNMAGYGDERYASSLSKVVLEGDLGEMLLGEIWGRCFIK